MTYVYYWDGPRKPQPVAIVSKRDDLKAAAKQALKQFAEPQDIEYPPDEHTQRTSA